MDEQLVIDILIRKSRYIGEILPLDISEDMKKELYKKGYFKDDYLGSIADKGNKILVNYYKRYEEKLLLLLKKSKNRNKKVNFETLIKELDIKGDWTHVMFLMKKLENNNKIIISSGSDWKNNIKYIIV